MQSPACLKFVTIWCVIFFLILGDHSVSYERRDGCGCQEYDQVEELTTTSKRRHTRWPMPSPRYSREPSCLLQLLLLLHVTWLYAIFILLTGLKKQFQFTLIVWNLILDCKSTHSFWVWPTIFTWNTIVPLITLGTPPSRLWRRMRVVTSE